MPRRRARNPFEQIILDNIARYGWHSNSVGAEDDSAIFAYTVGLYHTYGAPELLVFGLSPRDSHYVFMMAARRAQNGNPLDTDGVHAGLLPGRKCVVSEVSYEQYADLALSACWFYGRESFPMCQIVWPCERGRYPWHPNAPQWLVVAQPVLGRTAIDS